MANPLIDAPVGSVLMHRTHPKTYVIMRKIDEINCIYYYQMEQGTKVMRIVDVFVDKYNLNDSYNWKLI